jgi:Tol biopolymer transport system component
VLLEELSDPLEVDQDPALSGDGLEIVWASQRGGNADLWRSRRRGLSEPWEPPQRVEELTSEHGEASPHLAPDALSIWFASDRPGGAGEHDIWMATRDARDAAWSAPQLVSEVNSAAPDLAPSVTENALVLSSARAADTYDLYLASRSSTGSPWGPPAPIAAVNSAMSEWDPLLTQDGHELLFSSRRGASVDLYWAARPSSTASFELPQPLSSLNTEYSDHDPWWSPELGLIVFASDRSGKTALYEAYALP